MPENDIKRESVEENSLLEANLDNSEIEIRDKAYMEILCDSDAEATRDMGDTACESTPEKPRLIESIFEFVELLLLTLAAVFIITTFIFRHSVVDGDSMVGTLHNGENLIISNLFYEPAPGDIIVFEDHGTDLSVPVVKRVIAIGGQKVRVTATDIIVNGQTLREDDYAYFSGGRRGYNVNPSPAVYNTERYPDFIHVEDTYHEFTFPAGELFVLGDNRNISHDSRAFGTIKADSVFGRVLFRFYPLDKFGTVD